MKEMHVSTEENNINKNLDAIKNEHEKKAKQHEIEKEKLICMCE